MYNKLCAKRLMTIEDFPPGKVRLKITSSNTGIFEAILQIMYKWILQRTNKREYVEGELG